MTKIKWLSVIWLICTVTLTLTTVLSYAETVNSPPSNSVIRDLVPEWIGKVSFIGPAWAVISVGWIALGITVKRKARGGVSI